jgi:hypothetical protein
MLLCTHHTSIYIDIHMLANYLVCNSIMWHRSLTKQPGRSYESIFVWSVNERLCLESAVQYLWRRPVYIALHTASNGAISRTKNVIIERSLRRPVEKRATQQRMWNCSSNQQHPMHIARPSNILWEASCSRCHTHCHDDHYCSAYSCTRISMSSWATH